MRERFVGQDYEQNTLKKYYNLQQGSKSVEEHYEELEHTRLQANVNDEVFCDVVPMQACHLLLRRPWEYDVGAKHYGRSNKYAFLKDGKKHILNPLSTFQVSEEYRKMGELKEKLEREKKERSKRVKNDNSREEKGEVERSNYEDLFPEEIPSGFPPLRGIEHEINFFLGSQIPNKAAYRSNSQETKELQRHVEELLNKDLVRESLSPCVVPVILVPKKDGTWRIVVFLGFVVSSRGFEVDDEKVEAIRS
ncbi:uncharacterized protein LOC107852988 [Capsicum annuum]|uniref:uncharacterized protein LOC107852988 n=1 Tax=Capsicum annuum TaxID=4072 RepID=UPI0007BFAF67|nr:uncharacterized protein LOC107852988 [Capsicum annuum]